MHVHFARGIFDTIHCLSFQYKDKFTKKGLVNNCIIILYDFHTYLEFIKSLSVIIKVYDNN